MIEPYVFLFVAHAALTAVTLPQFLLDKVCQRNFNSTVCSNIKNISFKEEQDLVQKQTALWLTSIQSTMAGLTTLANFIHWTACRYNWNSKDYVHNSSVTGIHFIIPIILTLRESFHPALVLASVNLEAACEAFSGGFYTCQLVHCHGHGPQRPNVQTGFCQRCFLICTFPVWDRKPVFIKLGWIYWCFRGMSDTIVFKTVFIC